MAVSVPIFRNTVILKQLGIAIGIPFGLIALVIGLASGKSVYAFYGLGPIAVLLFFTWIFIIVVYRGKYEAEFVLDDKGVLCRTQAKQAKKNRIVNAITVVLGLLSGKPAVAGAGTLAQSRQATFRGGWTEQVALFCTEDNYAPVEREVMTRTIHLREKRL